LASVLLAFAACIIAAAILSALLEAPHRGGKRPRRGRVGSGGDYMFCLESCLSRCPSWGEDWSASVECREQCETLCQIHVADGGRRSSS
jgi:hypothetical protein